MTKKEVDIMLRTATKQFVEAERKLTDAQKTKRLAGVALGIAIYAALKANHTARENKRKIKRCEKKLQKLEDRDFT